MSGDIDRVYIIIFPPENTKCKNVRKLLQIFHWIFCLNYNKITIKQRPKLHYNSFKKSDIEKVWNVPKIKINNAFYESETTFYCRMTSFIYIITLLQSPTMTRTPTSTFSFGTIFLVDRKCSTAVAQVRRGRRWWVFLFYEFEEISTC